MKELLILFFVAAALAGIVARIHSRLVLLRNQFKSAFAPIDAQLKQRYELIPNVVETAKEYMSQERETLQAVIVARNSAMQAARRAAGNPADAAAIQQLVGAERGLEVAMKRLFALSASYPDLQADVNMLQLTDELSATERDIVFARRAYNNAVKAYNTTRETFPAPLFAASFGFAAAPLLTIGQKARRPASSVSS